MICDLFPDAKGDSPRLKWIEQHGVVTSFDSAIQPGDENERGDELFPWVAASALTGKVEFGGGDTEHEAIVDLAIKMGWKLWNE